MSLTQIESHLDALLTFPDSSYYSLIEAARYSLLAGGKRLRPLLTLAVVEAFNNEEFKQQALTPACALEMIHTYSLIHDDLPCMDDDDFRRGKPSLHKIYSEGHAVLTGDFLLTYAFEVIAQAEGLTAEQRLKLITILAKRSGGSSDGMIAGQVMDIALENRDVSLDQLKHIHQCKTGALIAAAVEFGAVIARANQQQYKAFSEFGSLIGLAFQVIDDVLDVISSEKKHGKSVSSDVINGKRTYVSLMGIEKAKAYAEQLYQLAIEKLSPLKLETSSLINLAEKFVYRYE